MSLDKLITTCVCGNKDYFLKNRLHDIDVLECVKCHVVHQLLLGYDENRYLDFYRTEYHEQFQESKKVITYKERYDHDRNVAKKRLDAYLEFIEPGMKGLDIGSSNSAFVHEANSMGFKFMGLEPGDHIGDDAVTIRGTLQSVELETEYYDVVTMHDSIEHMVDVVSALKKVKKILKDQGMLIVDLPDYFDPSGYHHWKQIEHIWFFTRDQFIQLLNKYNFIVEMITRPIPGKLVYYMRKV